MISTVDAYTFCRLMYDSMPVKYLSRISDMIKVNIEGFLDDIKEVMKNQRQSKRLK